MSKRVLDACCGSRMFWFDRANPIAVFMDNRMAEYTLPDKSSKGGTRELVIAPDLQASFTRLPFADETFALVVYDPPHLTRAGEKGWQARKYGKLRGAWRTDLKRGFSECYRVLAEHGTLIFKWSEIDVPVSEVLALAPMAPLFGHRSGKLNKTHWLTFMKGVQP